jgi:hypothetical protein
MISQWLHHSPPGDHQLLETMHNANGLFEVDRGKIGRERGTGSWSKPLQAGLEDFDRRIQTALSRRGGLHWDHR